jgi:hypothetical protein
MDQIEKYLDAANRVMVGVEEGQSKVEWPAQGPKAPYPRVVLFYVTRDLKPLDASHYRGRLYTKEAHFGLVSPS